MCQLISLKIYPQQQKQRHKNSLYIYWECQTIYSNSYLKTSQNPFVTFLCWYLYSKVVFLFEKHDFSRLIFFVKKFQEMGTKALFGSFPNGFSASYFPVSQEPLDQISSLTVLWNNNWKLQMLRKLKWANL